MRITSRSQPHTDEESKLDYAAACEHRQSEYLRWHLRLVRLRELEAYHAQLTNEARHGRTFH